MGGAQYAVLLQGTHMKPTSNTINVEEVCFISVVINELVNIISVLKDSLSSQAAALIKEVKVWKFAGKLESCILCSVLDLLLKWSPQVV